jgi:hypothetical protein
VIAIRSDSECQVSVTGAGRFWERHIPVVDLLLPVGLLDSSHSLPLALVKPFKPRAFSIGSINLNVSPRLVQTAY